jgi:hypothetical protein
MGMARVPKMVRVAKMAKIEKVVRMMTLLVKVVIAVRMIPSHGKTDRCPAVEWPSHAWH